MQLAIYCAGGLGKEVYDLAVRNNNGKYEKIFFVDDIREENQFIHLKFLAVCLVWTHSDTTKPEWNRSNSIIIIIIIIIISSSSSSSSSSSIRISLYYAQ